MYEESVYYPRAIAVAVGVGHDSPSNSQSYNPYIVAFFNCHLNTVEVEHECNRIYDPTNGWTNSCPVCDCPDVVTNTMCYT